MALNPRKMKATELTTLLNSTSFGEVAHERTIRRHRIRAGFRLGPAKHFDIFKYASWLTQEYHRPKIKPKTYEEIREAKRQRAMMLARAAQDIGDIPEVVDPARKQAACEDFKVFCETYFSDVFYLPWSSDHHNVIEKIEKSVVNGSLFAVAMPRGSGKTVLMQIACLWATLIGATKFVTLIASNSERAIKLLDTMKMWLETNEKLYEDFPEVIHPIRALERVVHRQKGQKYKDEATRIEWLTDKIVLPYIKGSKASGVAISCSGLKGSDIRGQNHARPDGKVVRPDLVMIDDPQTNESAWSPSQSKRREAILAGDILGMAGPGKKIAGLMACTVIRPGDMADSILNRSLHPHWRGQRTKMIYSFPTNTKLWEKYEEILGDSLRNDGEGSEATEFYVENREAMDAGAVVAWPERFDCDEVSGIQNAMNLKFRDEAAFFAEYQNEPIVETQGEEMLTAEQIAAKTNGYTRGALPLDVNKVTAFIDIQQKVLFWMVCGWNDSFSGYIIDYGCWPKQTRRYYTLKEIKDTLQYRKPDAGLEGQIYSGLAELCSELMNKSFIRDDGARLQIDRCLIDANWGLSTDVVYQFCRQSIFASRLLPSHGRAVNATSTPFREYRRKPGDQVGHHWRIPSVKGKRQVRHVLTDVNYWKSFVHQRFGVPMGDAGCLSIFGRSSKQHEMLADHLTSEYKTKVKAKGHTVDEWKLRAGNPDNHWLDCIVGCAAAASLLGAALKSIGGTFVRPKRKKLRLSEIQKRKRGWV